MSHAVKSPSRFRSDNPFTKKIRTAAGINPKVKFMGLRHGGNVEGAEAGLTDAQLRALSTAALLRYAQTTKELRRADARRMKKPHGKSHGKPHGKPHVLAAFRATKSKSLTGLVGAPGLEPGTR